MSAPQDERPDEDAPGSCAPAPASTRSSDSVSELVDQLEKLLPAARQAKHSVEHVQKLEAQVARLSQRLVELERELELQRSQTRLPAITSASSQGGDAPTGRSSSRSPGLAQRRRKAFEDRPRSSSEDGSFFSTYSKLHRVCSFEAEPADLTEASQPDQGDAAKMATQSTDTTKPSPLEVSQVDEASPQGAHHSDPNKMHHPHDGHRPQPFDEAVQSLEGHAIMPAKDGARNERAGYWLLTCNDEQCFKQVIPSGLVHIPHLTKMLVKCKWLHAPRMALIVKKPGEVACLRKMASIAVLLDSEGVQVVVEEAVLEGRHSEEEGPLLAQLASVSPIKATRLQLQQLPIDFCVCIGGDGTIIWTSHLFPAGCPPVVSIAMGSLGFLSTFSVEETEDALKRVLNKEMVLTLRSRLQAQVIRKSGERRVETVLNEVVVDRGPNSSIVNLDLFIGSDKKAITHVQGDGLIVATPTGSTAYSLSAGGSMIHPAIPCVVVTPICPHSLSFRPIVVSDTSAVRLLVPETARSSAFVSFDGRHQLELERGDELLIRVSEFPVPCICSAGESEDWFNAIKHGFNWNERTVQKQLQPPSSL